jgi:Flp pilus assembly protein TadG
MTRPPLRRSRTGDGERGSTALEFAVLSVAFLFLIFLVVQAALYYHARNVIKAEAEGVARAVRAYPATASGAVRDQVPPPTRVQELAQSEARKQWRILDNGGDTTSAPEVQADVVGFDQLRVQVSAKPIMILPGLFGGDLKITATSGGPFEVFKRSGDD